MAIKNMKVRTRIWFILFVLFYNLLLFLNLSVIGFFLILDEYYRRPNFDDPSFRLKSFNLSFYSMIIPLILSLFVVFYIVRNFKKKYINVAFPFIIAYMVYRFTSLKIFTFFSVTINPFINFAILSIPSLILIILSYKYLNKMIILRDDENL